MKWIGQHIWGLVTRFRNTVHLEDLSNAGGDTNKFLVVKDTEYNKVYFRTGPEMVSDIGASNEKGWHGSTTTIKILHSDFSADDGGRPVMIDDVDEANENFFLETHGTFKAYATIAIPTGYKATHVMVYGTNTPAIEVWEHQINSKTGVSKGTGNVDTEINITDVNSTLTNYLLIQVAQASGDEIHGGYVTITTI